MAIARSRASTTTSTTSSTARCSWTWRSSFAPFAGNSSPEAELRLTVRAQADRAHLVQSTEGIQRMTSDASVVPVLLSGGTGSRLWPLSREARPKQLLSLIDDSTLLQQTVARVDDASLFGAPIVIANAEHRFLIAEQLRAIGKHAAVILEPVGRSTAPAVAIAALSACRENPDAVILAMPVDHLVRDPLGFRRAVAAGLPAARAGRFVLFGIRPDCPATGMGYISIGEATADVPAVHQVAGFVEKPDLATATRFLTDGRHLWNSGIFLLPARSYLEELERLAPDVLAACRAALNGAA